MYSTCIFSTCALGGNTVLEEFAVGRRLAFDASRGRLWVVCASCDRWSLSPIEERWEAVEAARTAVSGRSHASLDRERRARAAPGGAGTVRIGAPQRPEFAAWRYGDQFGRRRRRAILAGVGAAAAMGTLATAGAALGAISGGVFVSLPHVIAIWNSARTVVRVRTAEGHTLALTRQDILNTRLSRAAGGEWSLVIGPPGVSNNQRRFTASEAERLAGLIVPRVNTRGAK